MKTNLILLHGAIGSKEQLDPLKEALKASFNVYSFNFSGHGGRLIEDGYTIDLFTSNLLAFMEEYQIEAASLFGYSMGGYVALNFAIKHPYRVKNIFTLATKFSWSEEIAAKETKMIQPETIENKIPFFAEILNKRHHPENWKLVLENTQKLMLLLGKKPVLTKETLSSISQKCYLSIGALDKMVSLNETQQFSGYITDSEVIVFNDFEHPIEKINIQQLSQELINRLS